MLISRLRLVTFDVTDTLLKLRSAPGQKYGEIGAIYGILGDNDALSKSFASHFKRMNKEHPNFGRRTGLDWELWWKEIVKSTFRDSHLNADDKKLEAIASHLIESYKMSTSWQHCYGISGLLSYIRSKGVPMGIISNFDPSLSQLLTNLKLRHYFQFVLASYETGFEKPDTRIFEEAMITSNIKNLKPDECLHVGDQVLLDYYGAKNSGWHAALINDSSPAKIQQSYPDIEVGHMFTSLYHLHRHFLETTDDNLLLQSLYK